MSLQTPTEDGHVLVEPGPDRLAELTQVNHHRLSTCKCVIHGRTLAELRAATRVVLADLTDDHPLIVTGHQPEFYHAGVWAKNIVASRLAAALGGRALNLVVDNDAPKKTSLTVPHCGRGMLTAYEVPFAEYHAGWTFEQLDGLDTRAAHRMVEEIRTALGDAAYRASAMPRMEPAFTTHVSGDDFVDQITRARKTVEVLFDLDLTERRVSRCWGGPMVLEILLNAARFAACYNAALADYRQAAGIRGTRRPVPDLLSKPDRIELPIWAYRRKDARRRLFVEPIQDAVTFYAEQAPIGTLGTSELRDPEALTHLSETTGWCLRPRALALTLWARLLLADLFIHGIGGAKYDCITDRLIRRYFEIEPPALACVSATVKMPMDRFPVSRDDLVAARRKARDVHYNPQRYLSAITADLSERLQRRVDRIAESQRLAREDRLNRRARREVFLAIRRANADLLAIDPNLVDRLESQVRRIEHQLAHNAVADSREYFFGLLPMEKLRRLADALPAIETLRGRS